MRNMWKHELQHPKGTCKYYMSRLWNQSEFLIPISLFCTSWGVLWIHLVSLSLSCLCVMATWRVIKRARKLIQCSCLHIVTSQQILTLCVYVHTRAVCVHTELYSMQPFWYTLYVAVMFVYASSCIYLCVMHA